MNDDTPRAHTNGSGRLTPPEATHLSPWILDVIRRFTLLDGSGTFDLAALARRPLTLPSR
jgi:hypothetical protein